MKKFSTEKLLVAAIAGFTTVFGAYNAPETTWFIASWCAGAMAVGALAFWLDEEDDEHAHDH